MKVFVEIQGQTFLKLTTLSDPLKLRDHERFPLLLSSVGKPGSDLPCGLSNEYGNPEGQRIFCVELTTLSYFLFSIGFGSAPAASFATGV